MNTPDRCVWSASISVRNRERLLVPYPAEAGLMGPVCVTPVLVTPVLKQREVHFMIEDGDDIEIAVVKGYEAATCLQLISSFFNLVFGKSISDIHFYARVGPDCTWQHIQFDDYQPEKVTKSWPERDSGEALGAATSTPVRERIGRPVADDLTGDPFAYWWHHRLACNQVIARFEIEIDDALHPATLTRQVPFGDITYEAREQRRTWAVFARHKAFAQRRLNTLCEGREVVFKTPLIQVTGRRGWTAAGVHVAGLETLVKLMEPGEHQLHTVEFSAWRDALVRAGGILGSETPESFAVSLPTEVDLNKGDEGSASSDKWLVVLKRGDYTFTMEREEAFQDDDVPY